MEDNPIDIVKKTSYILAGFIGGVAFLISCSGGLGSTGGTFISEAEAVVPAQQMSCQIFGNFISTSTLDPEPKPLLDSFRCYDTNGVLSLISLDTAYAEGWRVMKLGSTVTMGYWIFEK